MRTLGKLTVAATVAVAALATPVVVLVVAMRRKDPRVLGAVRRFNRDVTNPQRLRTAGAPGSDTSVLRHVGRRSGRVFETPLGLVPTEEGFVVALPYGPEVDWVRNLQAAGSATVLHEGREIAVTDPRLVPVAEAAASFPGTAGRVLRTFGVTECLALRRA